ncbi:hypothetical protein [uncultured Ruminococcus sp.]|uniref:hypothetical protein n=1 Tax=uncultured Ruminococcus sp. TaxID=165186 RepID=UPI00261D1EF3|nr:hypothetical protein [uncultured Ruminococcus sp.]
MNKHIRRVASVLFIVVILLAIAITRFYSNTSKSTSHGTVKTDIERRIESDKSGNCIFEDGNGLYGVLDPSDRVIVQPEWLELSFAGQGRCIASKRVGGNVMKGCVDYEGNIAVPFIYRNITPRSAGSQTLYIAESASDDSVVVYDTEFVPMFRKVWTTCNIAGDTISLKSSSGTYTYIVGENGMSFINAAVSGEALGCTYSFTIRSKPLLEGLDPAMLEYMSSAVGRYLAFAFTGDGSYVQDIRTGGRPVFTKLFPDEDEIIAKKLAGIKSVSFYMVNSDDGVPHYAVSVSADTEITYNAGDSDQPAKLRDDYKATVEFSGSSENDLMAVKGDFPVKKPEYPEPETEAETEPVQVPDEGAYQENYQEQLPEDGQ